jgi:hypothetical protein
LTTSARLGTPTGAIVCVPVGATVGVEVGEAVGELVGTGVASSSAASVGWTVGTPVGVATLVAGSVGAGHKSGRHPVSSPAVISLNTSRLESRFRTCALLLVENPRNNIASDSARNFPGNMLY